MARNRYVQIIDPIMEIHGSIPMVDNNGHIIRGVQIRYRKDTNRHYLTSIGRRNMRLHPYSTKEKETQKRFAEASQYASAVAKNPEQRAYAMARFAMAKAEKRTTAVTLRGFLMKEYLNIN